MVFVAQEKFVAMNEYSEMELSSLIDQLAEQTDLYKKMITEGWGTEDEFSQCREKITLIQEAIMERKRLAGDSGGRDDNHRSEKEPTAGRGISEKRNI